MLAKGTQCSSSAQCWPDAAHLQCQQLTRITWRDILSREWEGKRTGQRPCPRKPVRRKGQPAPKPASEDKAAARSASPQVGMSLW